MKAALAALALLPMVSASYFKPTTNQELENQVDACMADDAPDDQWNNDIEVCDDVESWDTSLITSMRALFNKKYRFNEDISAWDVSNVNDFAYMFRFDFNQDLSSWQINPNAGLTYMFDQSANMCHQLCGAAWVAREQAGTIPGNMFDCSDGSVATCDLCPAGQYAPTSNAEDALVDCEPCPAGTNSERAGQTFCVAAPPPADGDDDDDDDGGGEACSGIDDATAYQQAGCCNC